MFVGCITIYQVYVLIVHLTPRCSAPKEVTAINKQPVPQNKAITAQRSISEDKEVVELNEDYIATTDSSPVAMLRRIATNEHTSSSDITDDKVQSPLEGTSTDTNNQDKELIGLGSTTDIMQLLSKMLPHFCNAENVCSDNQNVSGTRIPDGSESCCTDCSCSPDCAQNGDCCFHEKLHQSNTECISEVYPPFDRFNTYKMVTSERIDESNTSTIEPCGDKFVTPWGNVFPVFSKSHKSIYINKYCADAYDVTDGVEWNVFVSCPTSYYYELMQYRWHHSMLPDDCTVYFEYPGDVKDIENLVCSIDNVSKHSRCRNENIKEIMTDVPFSGYEMMTACYSGLISPYKIRGLVFANVFCAICDDSSALNAEVCSGTKDITERAGDGLLYLLDTSVLQDLNVPPKVKPSQRIACVADKCRPLLCSSGKILTTTGVCEFVAKEWYNYVYIVPLLLTSDQLMNITDVFPKLSGSRSIRHLQSPWSKRWTIQRVLYESSPTGYPNMTDTIIVLLQQSIQKVSPKDLLKNVKRFKSKSWVIKTQNTKYILEAAFVRNHQLIDNGLKRTLTLQYGNVNVSTTLPRLSTVYDRSFRFSKLMLINEKFYCDQVELLLTEFETINGAIYNKFTGKFILYNHYTLLRQNSNISAIVCLENSGMTVTNNMADICCTLYHFTYMYALVLCIIVGCF